MKIKSKLLGSFVWPIAAAPRLMVPPACFFDKNNKEEMAMARTYFTRAANVIPNMQRASVIAVREMFQS